MPAAPLPPFKPGWSGARGLLISLLTGCGSFVGAALLFSTLGILPDTAAAFDSESAAYLFAMLLLVVALCSLIVANLLWFVWIYRANLNGSKLGSTYMYCTPGWALAWHFVPLLSYWKPASVLIDIWRESQPRDAHGVARPTGSVWITFCWVGLIVLAFAGQIGIRAIDLETGESSTDFPIAYYYMTLGCLALAGAVACTACIVRRIDQRQNASFILLTAKGAQNASVTPPRSAATLIEE